MGWDGVGAAVVNSKSSPDLRESKEALGASRMNEQRTLHPMLVTRVTLVRAADPFTRSSSDSLWMLPL